MKAAEEILREHLHHFDKEPDAWKLAIYKAMKEYAKEACGEQRLLCLAAWGGSEPVLTAAPWPELK